MLRIEVPIDKVNEAYETVTKDFQRKVALPGFRAGKAPIDLVSKRFARDIYEEVKSKLTNEGYQQALRDQKITVAGRAELEEVSFKRDEPFQFIANIETAPEFDLPEYKGVPAKRQIAKVTEADLNKAMMILRERQTKFDTVARELKEGDVAVVNYKGTVDGNPITDLAPVARGLTEQKNFWVNMDKGSFIPGFADQLIGAKAGDKRTVNVDFPADFVTPQLQGKKGTYEVEVVEVKQKILPELNDAFAQSYGADTVDQLKEGVRADLENELKNNQENAVREQIVQSLLDKIQTDLPETPVQEETRQILFNLVNENQRRGVPKEALEAKKEEIYASASAAAKERVKANFMFAKIAQKEGLKAEQADVIPRIQQLAMQNNTTADQIVKEYKKNNRVNELFEQALNYKVVEFLVKNAKVEEVPAEEEKA